MSLVIPFTMVMGLCSILTLVAAVFYWVWVCTHRRLYSLQTLIICLILLCEVATIIGSFIQFGIRADAEGDMFCKLGGGIFLISRLSAFLLSSYLVTSLFYISMGGVSRFGCLNRLSTERKAQALGFAIVFGLAIIFTIIIIFTLPDYCKGNSHIFWTIWVLTTIYNVCGLGFTYYNIRKISKKAKNDQVYLRLVLSISIVIGAFQAPSFIFTLATTISGIELLEDPTKFPLGCFMIFSWSLSVLQGFFFVMLVAYNQGVFSCCCGNPFGSTHDSSSHAPPTHTSQNKEMSDTKIKLEAHDMVEA